MSDAGKRNYPSYEARQAIIRNAWMGDNKLMVRLIAKAVEIAEERRTKAVG